MIYHNGRWFKISLLKLGAYIHEEDIILTFKSPNTEVYPVSITYYFTTVIGAILGDV